MTRWLLRASLAAAAWTGTATAQPLTPAALANTVPAPAVRAAAPDAPAVPDEGVVLVMRTTGQPERTLKVLRRSTFSDGESLVDVRDLMSGQTFTLPGKLADRLPRYAAGKAPPPAAPEPSAPAALQTPAPAVVLAPAPAVPPAPRPDLIPPPKPAAAAPAETVWKPVAPDPAPLPPVAQPVLQPLGSPATNPTAPVPLPVPAPAAPGDRWKPIPLPPPSPTPGAPGAGGVVARGQMPDAPSTANPMRPPMPRPNTWAPAVPSLMVERGPVADGPWLAEIVRREMRPFADQLATALRPSVRINAALGLADMRYAARPEVKAVLATAARTDPATLVRTVCVRELARLGYNDEEYVEFLKATAAGSPEQLRLAAVYALRLVTPRD